MDLFGKKLFTQKCFWEAESITYGLCLSVCPAPSAGNVRGTALSEVYLQMIKNTKQSMPIPNTTFRITNTLQRGVRCFVARKICLQLSHFSTFKWGEPIQLPRALPLKHLLAHKKAEKTHLQGFSHLSNLSLGIESACLRQKWSLPTWFSAGLSSLLKVVQRAEHLPQVGHTFHLKLKHWVMSVDNSFLSRAAISCKA